MRDKQFYKEQTGDNRFYVYIHRRATDNKPFYVGKGKGLRAWRTDRNNRFWQAVRKKHGFIVDIVFDDLLEDDAFQCEKDTILELEYFGYELTNQTRGGDGPSGYVYSDESKARMSYAQKTSEKVLEARKARSALRKGVKTGPNPRISAALKGKPKSAIHIAKAGEAKKDKRFHAFVRQEDKCTIVGNRDDIAGNTNLPRKAISALLLQQAMIYNGWLLVKEDVPPDYTVTQEDVMISLRRYEAYLELARERRQLAKEERAKRRVKPERKVSLRELISEKVHVFMNLITKEVFKGTRKDFSLHTGIDRNYIARFFSKNRLKKVKNWVLVEEEDCLN